MAGVAAEEVEHVLRGAHRALDPAQRVAGAQVLQALRRRRAARRRRSRSACPAWWPGRRRCGCGPVSTSSACSAARRARRASTATVRSRTCSRESRICSCSTFSVRSRLVMPLWMCSWPGQRGELLDARLDVVAGDPLAGGDGGEVDVARRRARSPRSRRPGTGTPRSRWARSTAIHSRRSSTTLDSGDQSRTSSGLA